MITAEQKLISFLQFGAQGKRPSSSLGGILDAYLLVREESFPHANWNLSEVHRKIQNNLDHAIVG